MRQLIFRRDVIEVFKTESFSRLLSTASTSSLKRNNHSPVSREVSFPYHSRLDHRTEPTRSPENSFETILKKYSDKKPTPGTLVQLIAMSNPKHRLTWGPTLQTELLVRLAHRINDFNRLPNSLLYQKPVQQVILMYKSYLEKIDSLEQTETPELNREFVRLLTEFKAKDSSTLPLIALGIQSWHGNSSSKIDKALAAQLDDIFTARLSIRMLIGQYCEYANQKTPGRIERGLVVKEVIEEAAQRATQMCINKFGVCPEVIIEGNLACSLTYVRSYLHHIVAELLKNSVRAVVEKHYLTATEKTKVVLPPVRVVIAGGKEDCVIKVSDEGGGIARSGLDKIWSYQFTTSQETESDVTFRSSFYGSGYGLPIARVFARYFGGDLDVISTEGYGTDAYVHIQRVESSAVEVLPD